MTEDEKKTPDIKWGKCPVQFVKTEDPATLSMTFNPKSWFLKEEVKKNQYCSDFHSIYGVDDTDLAAENLNKGMTAMPSGYQDHFALNVLSQSLVDAEPKDATEARLCIMQTALYSQGMDWLRKSNGCEYFSQTDHCIKQASKLLRLHNETVEALAKYRRKGEQRVVVQHVTVENGGKAVVGGIVTGGGDQTKASEVVHGTRSRHDATMSGQVQADRPEVQELCDQREAGMPFSWRQEHRSAHSGGQATAKDGILETWTTEQGSDRGQQAIVGGDQGY